MVQEFAVQITFRQKWVDPRLKFSDQNGEHLKGRPHENPCADKVSLHDKLCALKNCEHFNFVAHTVFSIGSHQLCTDSTCTPMLVAHRIRAHQCLLLIESSHTNACCSLNPVTPMFVVHRTNAHQCLLLIKSMHTNACCS